MKNNYTMSLFFVSMSPWPFLLSFSLMLFMFNLLIFLNKFNLSMYLIINLLLILMIMFFWWNDIVLESMYMGFHNNYIMTMTIYSMILFIISEIFFFVSFFWSFFHFMFSPDINLGSIWPYEGIYPMNFLNLPLLNSLLLISSGCSITWGHYMILINKMNESKNSLFLTILLGLIFIMFQMFEYYTSFFCFSDGIFGSIFFMATGFHGFHVLMGTLFILTMLNRLILGHFSSKHLMGFEFSIWYWHFVDIIWLYLYMMIYWLGS